MPTPASGQISMNDMRTHINRATSSAISMSEMRDRYGGSGQINFSDLYDCEGFTASPAGYTAKGIDYEGWEYRLYGFGSVSPNEASGIQVAANSYIGGMFSNTSTNPSIALMTFYSDASVGGGTITAGYTPSDVTRIVTANTSRTLGAAGSININFTYDWPNTGTIHCLVKF